MVGLRGRPRRATGAANAGAVPVTHDASSNGAGATPAPPPPPTPTRLRCPVQGCTARARLTLTPPPSIAVVSAFTNHVREAHKGAQWDDNDAALLPLITHTSNRGDNRVLQCPSCCKPFTAKLLKKHVWECNNPFKWKMDARHRQELAPAVLEKLAHTPAPQSVPAALRRRVCTVVTHLLHRCNDEALIVEVREGWAHALVAFHCLCTRKSAPPHGRYKDCTMAERVTWFEEGHFSRLFSYYGEAERSRARLARKKRGQSSRSRAKRNAQRCVDLLKEAAVSKAAHAVGSTMRIATLADEAEVEAKYKTMMDRREPAPVPNPKRGSRMSDIFTDRMLETLNKLDPKKAAGAFAISPSVLKTLVQPKTHSAGFLAVTGIEADARMAAEQHGMKIDPSAWLGAKEMASFAMAFLDGTFARDSFIVKDVFLASRGVPLVDDTKGKMRPIGIPCPWKSACSSSLVREHKERLIAVLGDQQVCLQRNAIDKTAHLLRARMRADEEHDDDASRFEMMTVSVDISGAFDNAPRPTMMEHVNKHLPMLARYVHLMLAQSTVVYTQGEKYHQQVGVIQGEPLSPVLFALLTVAPLKLALEAMCPTQAPDYRYRDDPIAMGYADDSTFYGPREQVLAGVATYAEHITAVGLTIETKVTKNFAWPLSASTRTSYSDNEEETITVQYKDETMQGGQGSFDLHLRNGDTGTAVLGVPIGDDAHVGAYMGAKRQGWAARLDALLDLPNVRRRGPRTSTAFEPGVQCAMYIARKCETHRLMFYLRTVPAAQWRHVMRQAADDMRAFVLKLSGCELELVEMSPYAKIMAAQPLSAHGFGLTDPTNIADIALGCSLAQCIDFLKAHTSTRHVYNHWRGMPPVSVSGVHAATEPPLLPLDHTEAACTTDYAGALTRLWGMVPKYLTHVYTDMAELAKSDTFPTSLLTDIEKLQHSLSKGRHRTVLLSLEDHVTVNVEEASSDDVRTRRHEALQLSHIATAAAAPAGKRALGSHTGAILNLLPMYPGRQVDNGTFRLFTIHMLRLWPDTTQDARGPYRTVTQCPHCNHSMFNFHVHALACPSIGAAGLMWTKRHDRCIDPVMHMLSKVCCDAPHKEPAGTNPDRNTRPDIEFRTLNANVTCGYDVVKIGKYNCADLSIACIDKGLILNSRTPPVAERPWVSRRQHKEQKHSAGGTHVCLPIVATVLGALDPYFTKWMVDAVESPPLGPMERKYDVRQFFSTFLITLWRYNFYIYEKYVARLSGVDDLSSASLPPRLG